MKWYMLVIDPVVAIFRPQQPLVRPMPSLRLNHTFAQVIKAVYICSLFINAGSVQAQQSVAVVDTAYIRVVNERAAKIVATLDIKDPSTFSKVQAIIAQQYQHLNQIHDASKAVAAGIKQSTSLSKEAIADALKKEEEAKEAKLLQAHNAYLTALKTVLNDEQVEKVKDGMTYGVLPKTYVAFQEMIPSLTEAQKKQIYAWLLEARDHAMDAESSDKKHWWFGKYKGKINNYLSAQGYDLKKETAAWAERRNAAKNKAGN